MRLLVWGHYSHTGFGTVTEQLASRFIAAGLDVRVIAVNHRGEPVKGALEGRIWPASMMGDHFGGDMSGFAISGKLWTDLDSYDEWKPDAMLVISDVSGLLSHIGRGTTEKVEAWRSLPVLHYCPIEGDNLNPLWRGVWNMVQPVAMSDYGQRVISGHIGRAVPRIYHGVDTDIFRKISHADPVFVDGKRITSSEGAKAAFGFEGRKLLLRADRNATRKFYYRLIEAFGEIAKQDPEVDLILHCQPQDVEGVDLQQETARQPADIQKRIYFTGAHDTWKGLDSDGLVALYNAADVYVSTTGGEGFGLTLAESLACETPVVVSDWAAEREVVGDGGILVPPLHDQYGDPVRYHSNYGMDWAMPDATGFVAPVLDLLRKPARRRSLGEAGRRHVKRSFNWDTAAAEFLGLLQEAKSQVA